ncbi:MAG: CpXC domain-containing protein [Verrucomicrobiaceae bacterium]|nr:CpXC domain-containing protein [Verrucomicrobiaceae bacterium]
MSVYHPTETRCRCGMLLTVPLVRSANAVRSPAIREAILRGTFHTALCPGCRRRVQVESTFLYTDLKKQTAILVKPKSGRRTHLSDSEALLQAAKALGRSLPRSSGHLRVVYGLGELREKLVCQDAGLDDRALELAKVLVIQDHPFLIHRPRLQMELAGVRKGQLEFIAYHHNQPERFRVTMPSTVVEQVTPGLGRVFGGRSPGSPDFWVNFRSLSTRYDALNALGALASDIQAGGKPVLTENQGFQNMIQKLPRGKDLSADSKSQLQIVFDHAVKMKDQKAQDQLIEVRFGKDIDDEWALNNHASDLRAIWEVLRQLPESNVEGNSRLDSLGLEKDADWVDSGYFDPSSDLIGIGANVPGTTESFKDVLRHEVGHAVYYQKQKLIDGWLETRFGWKALQVTKAGIHAWVTAMGGWGKATPAQKSEIINAIAKNTPAESFAGTRDFEIQGNPVWTKSFGPRKAFVASVEDWWENCARWHRYGGRRFYVNSYYRQLMIVSDETIDLVRNMPSLYAAMSPLEFFAELYAFYFDPDAKGKVIIPKNVRDWLDANIGRPSPAVKKTAKKRRG